MTADNTRPADGEFVMVPREPTEAMLLAVSGWTESVPVAEDDFIEYPVSTDLLADAYREMLSAAPQQHGQEADEAERLREQMEIVWRYLQKVSPWHASNDMLWCDEMMVGIDLLTQQASQPQQPAEAVAVDLEQFREPVRHWKAHVTGLANDAMRRGYSRDVVEAWENEEQNAGHLLAIIDNAPPAIDIGKLRELVERLKSMASGERERAKHYSVPARDAQAMHGLARILDGIVDKLAALIGDGGRAQA